MIKKIHFALATISMKNHGTEISVVTAHMLDIRDTFPNNLTIGIVINKITKTIHLLSKGDAYKIYRGQEF